MVGKKIKVLISTLLTSSILLTGCSVENLSGNESQKNKVIKIGITQIAEHSALDSSRKGFIDALESKGFKDGENIKIDYKNAQGDMPTAQTIAQSFVSDKKDLILAIATPTAQAVLNATTEIPTLITAVTDPVDAGLVKSMEKPETNITGTSDATPIEKQFNLIKQLIPNAKKIGVLYNTSERNSEIQVDAIKKMSKDFGFEIITAGVTSVNDIPQALESLLNKVDVLYAPTDNLVASSTSLIANKSIEKKIPFIASEEGMVKQGALATEGIDYYKLGLQTGLLAVDIINGKKPQEIPVTTLEDTNLVINLDTAKKLNIKIPDELNKRAQLLKGVE